MIRRDVDGRKGGIFSFEKGLRVFVDLFEDMARRDDDAVSVFRECGEWTRVPASKGREYLNYVSRGNLNEIPKHGILR